MDGDAAGSSGHQVILVVRLELGNSGSSLINQLRKGNDDKVGVHNIGMVDLDLDSQVQEVLSGKFYDYKGSLVYPPCSSQEVHWIVYDRPLMVTADQLTTHSPTVSAFDSTPPVAPIGSRPVFNDHVPLRTMGSGKSCNSFTDGQWTYSDTHCWPTNYPNCSGLRQSPIHIQSAQVSVSKGENFFRFSRYHPMGSLRVYNNGHSLQVDDFENGNSHLGFGYFELNGDFYFLRQLRLHAPSEHVVDGKTYPAELQLIHEKHKHWHVYEESILIVSILFDMGEESDFLRQLHLGTGLTPPSYGHFAEIKQPVDIARSFGPILDGDFYRYDGSFTAPPCDEIVKWFVFKDPLHMSVEQFESFKRDGFLNPANNRPVQPLNERVVALNSLQAAWEEPYNPLSYTFWLEREAAHNREKVGPYIVVWGVVGSVTLTVFVMIATFVRETARRSGVSAGGLEQAIGRV